MMWCSTVSEKLPINFLFQMIISIVFCLVLIEVLQQLSVHPLPENQIQNILNIAFKHFKNAAFVSQEAANNRARIVVDLFAEVIGVMAKTKWESISILLVKLMLFGLLYFSCLQGLLSICVMALYFWNLSPLYHVCFNMFLLITLPVCVVFILANSCSVPSTHLFV